MTQLTRWQPFGPLFPASHTFDELLRDFFAPSRKAAESTWSPRIDLKETPESYLVRAEVPGLESDGIEVTFQDGTLTLKGEKNAEETQEGENYHVYERRYGAFQRSFTFPVAVDADSVVATAENGVLTVKIRKAAEVKPRTIEVKTKD